MKFKISCSFGEIIDKMTILKIKEKKSNNKKALKNINFELKCIQNEIPLTKIEDELFNKLYKINIKLWELEDLIREKSKKKEYDNEYINYAESIHITNDKRYKIKKEINIKYNSDIIEEKIYI